MSPRGRPAKLGRFFDDTGKEATVRFPEEQGLWALDEDDYLLYALLEDPVCCAELLGDDPANHEYGGAYAVRDYQYPLFRMPTTYAAGACARKTGKTESIRWRAVSHGVRRQRENLLVTAPELIHLLPLTDAIESRIRSIRLFRDFLDTRGGKTGFTHRPFGVDYLDGTKIVGRIPRLTGTGVKGQHQPDLLIDEAQDYPAKGWIEVHETVDKDHTDRYGNPDFNYHFYGVHSGARDTGFYTRINEGGFEIVQVTALQRLGWKKSEKDAAKAAYGGSSNSDYRRNILGEAGAAASPLFVTARLFACVDQDRESDYNLVAYRHQAIRVEEFDELALPIAEVLDLPSGLKVVSGGADLGLTSAPTEICLFSREKVKGATREKLVRRFTLERMRVKTIRQAFCAIDLHFGAALKSFGLDETGIGAPIWQEVEDDEHTPAHFLQIGRGYFFNAKVPVHVDKQYVSEAAGGRLEDQYGAAVTVIEDPMTGQKRYVTSMPMIEASTRYLREDVDATRLLLPFDAKITSDMQGETAQRIQRVAGLKNKPNAFHILDSMRAWKMAQRAPDIEEALAEPEQQPVYDVAL